MKCRERMSQGAQLRFQAKLKSRASTSETTHKSRVEKDGLIPDMP